MTLDPKIQLDYEQTVAYFLHLAETRFKLLAFLPAATAATALISSEKFSAPWRTGLSYLGILVTVALIIYDQRNTHIYDRLVERAKFLERRLELPSWDKKRIHGGAFNDRASRLPHRFF